MSIKIGGLFKSSKRGNLDVGGQSPMGRFQTLHLEAGEFFKGDCPSPPGARQAKDRAKCAPPIASKAASTPTPA